MEGGGRAPGREARGRHVPWTPPRSSRPPVRAPLAGIGGPSHCARPPPPPHALRRFGGRCCGPTRRSPAGDPPPRRSSSRAARRSSRGGPRAGEPRRRRTPARAVLARPHAAPRRTGRAEALLHLSFTLSVVLLAPANKSLNNLADKLIKSFLKKKFAYEGSGRT